MSVSLAVQPSGLIQNLLGRAMLRGQNSTFASAKGQKISATIVFSFLSYSWLPMPGVIMGTSK